MLISKCMFMWSYLKNLKQIICSWLFQLNRESEVFLKARNSCSNYVIYLWTPCSYFIFISMSPELRMWRIISIIKSLSKALVLVANVNTHWSGHYKYEFFLCSCSVVKYKILLVEGILFQTEIGNNYIAKVWNCTQYINVTVYQNEPYKKMQDHYFFYGF